MEERAISEGGEKSHQRVEKKAFRGEIKTELRGCNQKGRLEKTVGPKGPTDVEWKTRQGDTHSRLILVWNMKFDSVV